ncbi:thiamine pyrophosphate-binding protein [Thermaerobacter subterraneus]|uniref:Thiamine pyrophosphate-dependent enzyme, putative carboligase or decarboxylase n=1 Tax=Thermaerobacter subterraneus DSM 13965 TaxID=867903 RepID=K6Q2T3_9FIRM|nr:thiamine pyrophosphate-dependent enzyme [Thermaerobacter subterraneus]EKP95359.1 thiamine pyrophosphate-dependent enzyme, putative carboligase or decarboxylase [Thermaerobacter subterraneus DSM 13965]
MTSRRMTVADYVAAELAEWDIPCLFGVPGDSIIPLLEAVRQNRRPRFVAARHEGAAAIMAAAYAKLSGQMVACCSDAGPGAVQMLNGVYDAAMDRVPLLAITGGLPTAKTATHWPQDANLDLVYTDATVFNHTLAAAGQATRILPTALRAAWERPGPARVGLPVDLQRQELAGAKPTGKPGYLKAEPAPDQREIDAALHLLRTAMKPVILAGRGARAAREALLALAEALDAPIVSTLPGLGAVPAEHRHYCGVLGEAGTQAAADVMGAADVALVVGSTWWQPAFVPRGLKVIQVDIRRAHLGMTLPVEVALAGPAETVVSALRDGIKPQARESWHAFWERARATWHAELQEADAAAQGRGAGPGTRAGGRGGAAGRGGRAGEGVHPAALMTVLSGVVDPGAVICVDTGQHTYWFGRYFFPDRQMVLVSGHWRTVGFALPAAIGAALAAPRRPVVALAGDGGLGMTLMEFTTAVRERLPIVVICCNDGRFAEEEELQVRAGVEPFGTRFVNPDFAAFAETAGGVGIRVERVRDLEPALERALRVDGPVLVDVRVAQVTYPRPEPVAHRDPWAARTETETREAATGTASDEIGRYGDPRQGERTSRAPQPPAGSPPSLRWWSRGRHRDRDRDRVPERV